MASLGAILEPHKRPDEAWKPHQPSGMLGVDYDSQGAEMAPNARVWKKYVEEADKTDKELVEGWNKTLDVILIFAALFSAISTAFVIESSKDLKPDYSQTSAQTLQIMSQTLSAIAGGSLLNESDITTSGSEPASFVPSPSAVAVNALWFLSLSLSVAVSLIAILAKEWCHSFMAGRVGSMLRQARLRQQRWDGIEQWKMKEILYVLPLLMHTALLLFAVGLSLYLWDINVGVALPVIITTSLAALFYVVTVSLPLFFRFCPYTTAVARLLYPYLLAVLGSSHTMNIIGALIASLAWISHVWMHLKQTVRSRGSRSIILDPNDSDLEATEQFQSEFLPFSFYNTIGHTRYLVQEWIESMRGMFLTDRSQLVEDSTPMDNVTSSMIVWMVSNCEDSKSVDMALQALAGAEPPLPRLPLWECGALLLLYQRIETSTNVLKTRPESSAPWPYDNLLDDASLYSRSFSFLTEFVVGEGLIMPTWQDSDFIVGDNRRLANTLVGIAFGARSCILNYLQTILDCAWARPAPRYDLIAYEFNNVPVEAGMDVWTMREKSRNQCRKQWEIVQHITSGKVTNLTSNAVTALVNGITKSYLYDPSGPPTPLVNLLIALTKWEDHASTRHAIAVGLAVAAFATGSYPSEDNLTDENSVNQANLTRAKQAYTRLSTGECCLWTNTLLTFGLLCLLNHRTKNGWSLDDTEVRSIGGYFDSLWSTDSYHDTLPAVMPASFDCGNHLAHVVSDLFSVIPLDKDLEPSSPVLLRIEAALKPSLCAKPSGQIVPVLARGFINTESVRLKRLCLQGIKYSLHTGDYKNTPGDITLDSMELLWAAGGVILLSETMGLEDHDRGSTSQSRSLLQSLCNEFMVNMTDDALPADQDEIGFPNLWLPSIATLCRSNPQSVVSSGILSTMISFYEIDEHADTKPRTPDVPKPFDETWTWLRILQKLDEDCREAMGRAVAK